MIRGRSAMMVVGLVFQLAACREASRYPDRLLTKRLNEGSNGPSERDGRKNGAASVGVDTRSSQQGESRAVRASPLPRLLLGRTPDTSPTHPVAARCGGAGCRSLWWGWPRATVEQRHVASGFAYSENVTTCKEGSVLDGQVIASESTRLHIVRCEWGGVDEFGDLVDTQSCERRVLRTSDGAAVHEVSVDRSLAWALDPKSGELYAATHDGDVYTESLKDVLALRRIAGFWETKSESDAPRVYFGAAGDMYASTHPPARDSVEKVVLNGFQRQRLRPAHLSRFWMSDGWVLRSMRGLGIGVWDVARVDGSGVLLIAAGDVGACGYPLSGDLAWAVDGSRKELLGLSLRTGAVEEVLSALPLEQTSCVAAGSGLLAVSGVRDGYSGVAIYSEGLWHWVSIAISDGDVLEPYVDGSTVLVSRPEEAGANRVAGRGAVYVITAAQSKWGVRGKIVANDADASSLFGSSVGMSRSRLYISYLAQNPSHFLDAWDMKTCSVELLELNSVADPK